MLHTTWRPECLQQHVFLITYSATHIDRLAKDYEWKWTNCVWLRPGRKNANGNKFTRRFPRSTLSHHWGKKGKKPVASYLEAEGTDQFFILRWSTWALPHHFPSPRNDGNAWWLLDYYRKQENSLTWCVLLLWFVDIFKLIHYSIYGESPENVRVIGLTIFSWRVSHHNSQRMTQGDSCVSRMTHLLLTKKYGMETQFCWGWFGCGLHYLMTSRNVLFCNK